MSNRIRRRGLSLATLVASLGTSSAAVLSPVAPLRPASRTFSWPECVDLALHRNPDLNSAVQSAAAGRATYRQSYNSLFPSLVLSNSYGSGSLTAGRQAYTAAGTANISIFDAGKIASIRSASAGYDQAQAALRSASASARYNLRQAFAQELFAESKIGVATTILAIRAKGAEMVSLRYDSGHEYKGNMMNTNAQRLQAEASLAQARRDLRTARRSMARQLGLDDFEEVAATGTLTTPPPDPIPDGIGRMVDSRPDVALQEALVRSARAGLASAESPLWPSLAANYSRTRADSVEFPSRTYGWSAGATLSYALFGGGPASTYFAVQASRRGVDKAEQDLRSVRNAALVDLETAWSAYAAASDQVLVQQAQLESARQRNAEADVRYASGLLNFDNWELIVSERVSNEQSSLQAQLNAVVAQAAWERSVGRLLGE